MAAESHARDRNLRTAAGPCRHLAVAFGSLAVTACGAALPSLAPAHPLSPGQVEVGVGSAAALLASNTAVGPAAQAARSALVPSVVGWLSPRVGLPGQNEIWAVFTGGTTGLGARHAWVSNDLALSAGVEGSWIAHKSPALADDPDAATWRAQGWQASVPVVFGWRSSTRLVTAWAGARGRFARVTASGPGDQHGTIEDRVAGALAGLSVGVHPIWVRVELLAEYHNARLSGVRADAASPTLNSGNFEAFSLTPAGALAIHF